MVLQVRPQNVFYVCDGTSVASLEELGARLKRMSPQAFSHHVTSTKNDFSNWVRDCIGNPDLASALLVSSDQREMCQLIGEHIAKIKAEQGGSRRQMVLASQQRKERTKPIQSMRMPAMQAMDPPNVQKTAAAQRISLPQNDAAMSLSEISESINRLKQSVVASAKNYSPVAAQPKPKETPKPAQAESPSALEKHLLELSRKEVRQSPQRKEPPKKAVDMAPVAPTPRKEKKTQKPAKEKARSQSRYEPVLKLPLEAYNFKLIDSQEKVSTHCDHSSHAQCMRCGLTEFMIGLIVGLALAFILARTFMWV